MLVTALGSSDPDFGYFLRDLAYVYAAQKKFDEARNTFGDSLTILESELGSKGPTVVETRRTYEQILRDQAVN
jgi:hypothetical protein